MTKLLSPRLAQLRAGAFAIAAIVLTLSSLSGAATAPTGNFDGDGITAGSALLFGWACVPGSTQALTVNFYVGDHSDRGGTLLASAPTNVPSEAGVNSACGTSGGTHRFQYTLTAAQKAAYYGKPVFAYVTANGVTKLLSGAGLIPTANVLFVSSYGAVADGKTDATAAVQKAFAAAVSASVPTTIAFGTGTYLLKCASASLLPCLNYKSASGAALTKGLVVLGSYDLSTHLLIGNSLASGFEVSLATNVTIGDLTIDYVTSPFIQGRITAANLSAGSPNFTFTQTGGQAIPASVCAAIGSATYPYQDFGILMDSVNGRSIKHNGPYGGAIIMNHCTQNSSTSWTIGVDVAADPSVVGRVAVNDQYVQLIGRQGRAISFENSTNVRVDNVSIYASPGLATFFYENLGSITVRGLTVGFSPGSTRFLTTNADGVHMQQNWAKPLIEDCSFTGMADDAINNYAVASYVRGPVAGSANAVQIFLERPVHIGDWLEIIGVDGTPRGAGAVVSDVAVSGENYHVVTLSAPVGAVHTHAGTGTDFSADDMVFDDSAGGPNATFRDNYFARHRGRGIVNHSPSSLILDNTFVSLNTSGVQLTPILSYPDVEGPVARNVTVQGNSFQGGDPSWGATIDIGGPVYWANDTGNVQAGPSVITLKANKFLNISNDAIDIGTGSYDITIDSTTMTSTGVAPRVSAGPAIALHLAALVNINGLSLVSPDPNTVRPYVLIDRTSEVTQTNVP